MRPALYATVRSISYTKINVNPESNIFPVYNAFMMPDDLQDKNSHSLYLSNEAMAMAAELAQQMGISARSQVFEIAIRSMYDARSAITYEIAKQIARKELEAERRNED